MCLGEWSELGLIKDDNVKDMTLPPEAKAGEEDMELSNDWDKMDF